MRETRSRNAFYWPRTDHEQVLCPIRNPWLRASREDLWDPQTREERIVIRDPFTTRRSLARNRKCSVIFVGDSAILETLICRGYRGGLGDSRTRPERKGWWIAFTANAKTEGSAPLIPLMSCPPREQAWLCAPHSLCLSNVFRLADPISWIASLLLPPVGFKRSLGIFSFVPSRKRNFRFDREGFSDSGSFQTKLYIFLILQGKISRWIVSRIVRVAFVVILLAPSRKNRRHNFWNNASLFREGVVCGRRLPFVALLLPYCRSIRTSPWIGLMSSPVGKSCEANGTSTWIRNPIHWSIHVTHENHLHHASSFASYEWSRIL